MILNKGGHSVRDIAWMGANALHLNQWAFAIVQVTHRTWSVDQVVPSIGHLVKCIPLSRGSDRIEHHYSNLINQLFFMVYNVVSLSVCLLLSYFYDHHPRSLSASVFLTGWAFLISIQLDMTALFACVFNLQKSAQIIYHIW